MSNLSNEIFVCLDCETTGLDTKNDRIIEVACVRFNKTEILDSFESLVNPHIPIPEASTKIHNITDQMVKDSPSIEEVLPKVFELVGAKVIVGHGIQFDLDVIHEEAVRAGIEDPLYGRSAIDTLRLARLYGEAPKNSLSDLRQHFNIESMGAHRAMGDVLVNVDVFRHLSRRFKSLSEIFDILSRPIEMRLMPLGKHKGRLFKEVPLDYLRWAAHQNYDQDLLYSIRKELSRRKAGNTFTQSSNPFSSL